ncbi:MAG: aminotransferase class I/II-fold pyridoxal phosphate-dependent enzyme [Candidatus Aminicenantes bacterium]|nr:aminotransferase class I/II-fold pyridoxal phosphate-dependent enzyme [Candidatus Aminicenantes bacterium]
MNKPAPLLRPDSEPGLVVTPPELAGLDSSLSTMSVVPGSRMFEIRDALAVYERDFPGGEQFDASQGDGGASLPGVPAEIFETANKLQIDHGSAYDQPFGCAAFRKSVVEEYWKLDSGLSLGPENIIAVQGGRDGLLKAYEAALFLGRGRRGDFVITSRVPWISYNWGPYLIGANVLLAPGREDEAWRLTPDTVRTCAEYVRRFDGREIAMLIVTSPDNPTGRILDLESQAGLARAAFAAGVPFVLFDWIYHHVTDEEPYDLNRFLRLFAPEERDRCIFLDGITKSLGASNVRNAHLVASKKVVKFIQNRASHAVVPSFHSQAVAMAAYRMGFDKACAGIVGPTNASRRILSEFLAEKEFRTIVGKGYYAFIDVGPWIDRAGLKDSADMGSYLAERFGLAVVPGVYFSEYGRRWIRFSYALPPEKTRRAAARLWDALSAL